MLKKIRNCFNKTTYAVVIYHDVQDNPIIIEAGFKTYKDALSYVWFILTNKKCAISLKEYLKNTWLQLINTDNGYGWVSVIRHNLGYNYNNATNAGKYYYWDDVEYNHYSVSMLLEL